VVGKAKALLAGFFRMLRRDSHHCAIVSLCQCVTVPLCHCATVSTVPCSEQCGSIRTNRCVIVSSSLCHCVTVSAVTVSLCHCVTVSLCHCVDRSMLRTMRAPSGSIPHQRGGNLPLKPRTRLPSPMGSLNGIPRAAPGTLYLSHVRLSVKALSRLSSLGLEKLRPTSHSGRAPCSAASQMSLGSI